MAAGAQYYLALNNSGVFNDTYLGSEFDGTKAFFLVYTPA